MKKLATPVKNKLIGKYFHSLNGQRQVEWQGIVVGVPEPGWYLVQLFEWGFGEPNVMRLVPFEHIRDWLFYPSADAMKHSYDHGIAREGGHYRKKIEPESRPVSKQEGRKFFQAMREAAK